MIRAGLLTSLATRVATLFQFFDMFAQNQSIALYHVSYHILNHRNTLKVEFEVQLPEKTPSVWSC